MKKFLVCFFMLASLFTPAVFASKVPTAGDDISAVSVVMRYKDVSHNWRVLNKMKTQAKTLSEEEKSVIKKYVYGAVRGEDTYLLINCHLRNILPQYVPAREITTPLKCRLDYYAKALSTVITKMKLPQNMILYRGIDEKGMKYLFPNKNLADVISKPVSVENSEKLKQQISGEYYLEKGFMSTSYDKSCARQTKFIFEVNAPKNLQAVLIEDIGKKQEKEVIINKNSKWKVTDVSVGLDKKTKKQYYLITIKYAL